MSIYPNIRDLFSIIAATPGATDKKTLIQSHNSELLHQIFEDTYDESKKYYVKKFEMPHPDILGVNTIDENYTVFHDMLISLSKREVTGQAAIDWVEETIGSFVAEDRDILTRILDRNLKIGVSLDNYNNAVGIQAIKKYQVALAEKLQDVKGVDIFDGTYYMSRKLDGCRCNIHIINEIQSDGNLNQEVKFISRQGKEFNTLDNLIPSIKKITEMLNGHWVLDGEVCLIDEKGQENFRGLMSEVTRKNHTISNPKFMWFDIVKYDEFLGQATSPDFSLRYQNMCELYYEAGAPGDVEVLKQDLLLTEEQFNQAQEIVKKEGWEGLMLRKNVPYKSGRTKDLIKVKKMQDAEFIVEDVIEGQAVYNEGGAKTYDVISALCIMYKGNVVKVGSGLSKEQRIAWRKDRNLIVGKTITVQYFEETMDKKTGEYSLRFPILKYVYEHGRTV